MINKNSFNNKLITRVYRRLLYFFRISNLIYFITNIKLILIISWNDGEMKDSI